MSSVDPKMVKAALGPMPAPITNPEAWPPNYADGFNDCCLCVREFMSQAIAAALREQPPPSAPVGVERKYPDDGNGDDDAYNRGWNDCLSAVTQQPAQAAPGGLTADEREWLDYAIEHMRDDSEPEDLTCADVLEALLQRATPPGDDAAGGGS